MTLVHRAPGKPVIAEEGGPAFPTVDEILGYLVQLASGYSLLDLGKEFLVDLGEKPAGSSDSLQLPGILDFYHGHSLSKFFLCLKSSEEEEALKIIGPEGKALEEGLAGTPMVPPFIGITALLDVESPCGGIFGGRPRPVPLQGVPELP